MKYDRTIIAYHGCDAAVAARILNGEPFKKSQNKYDWLGEGIYFWEYGADRAIRFAEDQRRRGKVTVPTVVGALIQLGRCFDLMDTHFTSELSIAFVRFKASQSLRGLPMPENRGATPDKLLRLRDCAVMNYYLRRIEEAGEASYDTVRCCFIEGEPAFDGSGIQQQSHVQIAVRNPACVVGVFRPTITP